MNTVQQVKAKEGVKRLSDQSNTDLRAPTSTDRSPKGMAQANDQVYSVLRLKKGGMTIESEIEEDVSNSVLVMDIQERRFGPESYARLVKEDLKRENGAEKFEQCY